MTEKNWDNLFVLLGLIVLGLTISSTARGCQGKYLDNELEMKKLECPKKVETK